jgi:hypothetical protein
MQTLWPKLASATRKALDARKISRRALAYTGKQKPKGSAWLETAGESQFLHPRSNPHLTVTQDLQIQIRRRHRLIQKVERIPLITRKGEETS